jgi:hypothetical protein
VIDTRVTPQRWLWAPRTKPIKIIEIHATRGNTTPEKQKPASLNWVQSPHNVGNRKNGTPDYDNPEWGSSFSHVIGTDGSMGTVLDDNQMPTYSAGYGGAGTYAIDEYAISYECAQSQAQEPFTDALYARLAKEVAGKCLQYGIPPVMVSIMVQKGEVPTGIVRHDRCENGIKLGKTDPGVQFNEVRFIAAVKAEMEGEMAVDEARVQEMIDAAFVKQNSSEWRFDSIRDNLDGMNKAQKDVVVQIADARIKASGAVPAGHNHPHQHGEAG